jgi:hypothetical protein
MMLWLGLEVFPDIFLCVGVGLHLTKWNAEIQRLQHRVAIAGISKLRECTMGCGVSQAAGILAYLSSPVAVKVNSSSRQVKKHRACREYRSASTRI